MDTVDGAVRLEWHGPWTLAEIEPAELRKLGGGIYLFLVGRRPRVAYVGQTDDFLTRLVQHCSDQLGGRSWFVEVPEEEDYVDFLGRHLVGKGKKEPIKVVGYWEMLPKADEFRLDDAFLDLEKLKERVRYLRGLRFAFAPIPDSAVRKDIEGALLEELSQGYAREVGRPRFAKEGRAETLIGRLSQHCRGDYTIEHTGEAQGLPDEVRQIVRVSRKLSRPWAGFGQGADLRRVEQSPAPPAEACEPRPRRRDRRRPDRLREHHLLAPAREPGPGGRGVRPRHARNPPSERSEVPARVVQHVRQRVPDLARASEDVEVVVLDAELKKPEVAALRAAAEGLDDRPHDFEPPQRRKPGPRLQGDVAREGPAPVRHREGHHELGPQRGASRSIRSLASTYSSTSL